jgi:NADPH:quinone reductase-like Zn-dependent oxidoreductase
MNKALVKSKLRRVIDAVYPFADAMSAFRHLEHGAFGKVVIRVRA